MENNSVVKIWCEWDVGQDDLVFSNVEVARDWIDLVLEENDMYEDGDTLEDFERNGLVGYSTVMVITCI